SGRELAGPPAPVPGGGRAYGGRGGGVLEQPAVRVRGRRLLRRGPRRRPAAPHLVARRGGAVLPGVASAGRRRGLAGSTAPRRRPPDARRRHPGLLPREPAPHSRGAALGVLRPPLPRLGVRG